MPEPAQERNVVASGHATVAGAIRDFLRAGITTRTIQGRLLLRPSPELTDIILGIIGKAQARYGMTIHAFVFLSTHALLPDERPAASSTAPQLYAKLGPILWELGWSRNRERPFPAGIPVSGPPAQPRHRASEAATRPPEQGCSSLRERSLA